MVRLFSYHPVLYYMVGQFIFGQTLIQSKASTICFGNNEIVNGATSPWTADMICFKRRFSFRRLVLSVSLVTVGLYLSWLSKELLSGNYICLGSCPIVDEIDSQNRTFGLSIVRGLDGQITSGDQRVDRLIVTNKRVGDRQSYLLWKRIKVRPEYKKGNRSRVRFGDELPLYYLPNTEKSESSEEKSVSFPISTNGLIDCQQFFFGNGNIHFGKQAEITVALKYRFQEKLQAARNSCESFSRFSGYVTSSLTSEERDFPIAFSIVIFKDVEQFEILLKSIYRPQNVYCIHIDKKSPDTFRQAVGDLIACLDNVFVATTSVDVKWGTFSVLEPDIVCLRELFKHTIKWKYFINLTGQELPLRTNYELVKILKAFNGANNVEASRLEKKRLKKAGRPPFNVTPIKGAVHVILSRAFVDYMLHNETAVRIYEWSKKVGHASEVFFSTLNFNRKLEAPGSYRGTLPTNGDEHPLLARLKNWGGESFCSGKLTRRICILSPGELPLMATREELFANKLHFDYHPEMLVCMPELIANRTVDEYNGLLLFNDTYYKSRDFVINRF